MTGVFDITGNHREPGRGGWNRHGWEFVPPPGAVRLPKRPALPGHPHRNLTPGPLLKAAQTLQTANVRP